MQTKKDIDTADKICASFNVARNVKTWLMAVFFAMRNISVINSQLIYHKNGFKPRRRKIFPNQ